MDIVGPHACSSVSEWSWIVLHGSLAINSHVLLWLNCLPGDICSVERLELVCLHRSLILMKMGQWILSTVVVRIIVCIDGLRLEACNGIELLDRRSTETCKSPENSTFDLRDFSVLNSVHQGILGLGRMVLKFFSCVFLAKRCNLVEVHLKVVCHLLC